MTIEMHPQRWGDAARATALAASTRALVDAAFGARSTPARDTVELPEPGLPADLLVALGAPRRRPSTC